MNSAKFRKMTQKQLKEALEKAQEELSNIRFDVRVGQEKDYGQIVWKKKEIARMQTVMKGKVTEKSRIKKKKSNLVRKEKSEKNTKKKQIEKS